MYLFNFNTMLNFSFLKMFQQNCISKFQQLSHVLCIDYSNFIAIRNHMTNIYIKMYACFVLCVLTLCITFLGGPQANSADRFTTGCAFVLVAIVTHRIALPLLRQLYDYHTQQKNTLTLLLLRHHVITDDFRRHHRRI